MSKMDDLRAMREARYERTTARAARTAAKPPVAPPLRVVTPAQRAQPPEVAEPDVAPSAAEAEQLCGHRNMGGRTCTREHGHAAKSHRYS